MSILQSIILGIVEGLTEFLPISSTFHLIWASKLVGIAQTESQKLFEVVIQAGAILAVISVYTRTLLSDRELLKKVVVSFVPTAIIGFLLYKLIKGFFFDNYLLQLAVFAIVGILFIVFEKVRPSQSYARTINDLSYTETFMVGVAQALSVIPGVSRAGAVILALMFLHTKRDEAAKYSFLLAIPTIIGAAALDLFKSRDLLATTNQWTPLLIGSLAAFITSLVVIKWLIKYLQTHTISIFGWYRIAMLILLLLIVG